MFKLEHYYNQEDIEKYVDMKCEIHNRIWDHLSNKYLQKTLKDSLTHIRRCYYTLNSAFLKKEILKKSMESHKDILEALKKMDKKKLKQLIQQHWNPPLL